MPRKSTIPGTITIPNKPITKLSVKTRGVLEPVLTNNSIVETVDSFTFTLNSVANFTNYTRMFDQYKINKVVVQFIPILTEIVNRPYDDTTTPGGAPLGDIPNYVVAIDRDDTAVSATYADLKARAYSYVRKSTQPLTICFRPNRLVNIYNGIIGSDAYQIDSSNQWLDSGYNGVPHYGLKFAQEVASPRDTYSIMVRTTYYLSFANRRE